MATQNENIDSVIYQFCPELEYPVYIAGQQEAFSSKVGEVLEKMGFKKLIPEPNKKIEIDSLMKRQNAILLNWKWAGLKVGAQIGQLRESDQYGSESITPQGAHNVYRYRGYALLIYSFQAKIWEAGVLRSGFLNSKNENEEGPIIRTLVTRFLSWALSPFAVYGLWGIKVKKGLVIMTQGKSLNEAVFLDLRREKMIVGNQISNFPAPLQIYALDSSLKNGEMRLKAEEFYCRLINCGTFFHFEGPTVALRQMAATLSKTSMGQRYSEVHFSDLRDLSY